MCQVGGAKETPGPAQPLGACIKTRRRFFLHVASEERHRKGARGGRLHARTHLPRSAMGTALTTRLGLGLLLLALLLPTQTSQNTTSAAPTSKATSNSTALPLTTLNITTPTKAHGNSLQATTGLFILSISVLYVC